MDLELTGNRALVTASTSGLGLASAQALAAEGVDVAICGRGADRLETAVGEVETVAEGEVLGVQADLTSRDEVVTLVAETVDAFGGLDHVVTSAGGPPSTTFEETTTRQWYEAYDQLVMSVVWTLEASLAHLHESDEGSIVCIASRTVREVADGLLLSNAVRRAVIGLVKSVSREFAPEVRVNAVLPGTIETPRIAELIEARVERGTYADYDEGLAAFAEAIPMGRLGEPIELGDVVAFLSSARAGYVTGVAVPIDGGQLRS